MATTNCTECDETIELTGRGRIGQKVVCPNCGASLEVVSTEPLELDLALDDDEGWEDELDALDDDETGAEADEEEEGDLGDLAEDAIDFDDDDFDDDDFDDDEEDDDDVDDYDDDDDDDGWD